MQGESRKPTDSRNQRGQRRGTNRVDLARKTKLYGRIRAPFCYTTLFHCSTPNNGLSQPSPREANPPHGHTHSAKSRPICVKSTLSEQNTMGIPQNMMSPQHAGFARNSAHQVDVFTLVTRTAHVKCKTQRAYHKTWFHFMLTHTGLLATSNKLKRQVT